MNKKFDDLLNRLEAALEELLTTATERRDRWEEKSTGWQEGEKGQDESDRLDSLDSNLADMMSHLDELRGLQD